MYTGSFNIHMSLQLHCREILDTTERNIKKPQGLLVCTHRGFVQICRRVWVMCLCVSSPCGPFSTSSHSDFTPKCRELVKLKATLLKQYNLIRSAVDKDRRRVFIRHKLMQESTLQSIW